MQGVYEEFGYGYGYGYGFRSEVPRKSQGRVQGNWESNRKMYEVIIDVIDVGCHKMNTKNGDFKGLELSICLLAEGLRDDVGTQAPFFSLSFSSVVTVRNKKRVGYTYELTLKFKGDWLVKEEKKRIQGHLDIPEFSFGELDDLQVESRLSDDKDLTADEKVRIRRDLQSLVAPIRMKLQEFEQELKDR
ncbi:uncharacterized protein LOC109841928 [Asparagus officinalis]|uniref:uncharacterized protein LOC109841928 n=1 Tax=Asparagus officinalis TaxID=4686 RepID=UPI00098E658F|nr:uncharacterized protein LOC109841928 [Asparagus officinalis]